MFCFHGGESSVFLVFSFIKGVFGLGKGEGMFLSLDQRKKMYSILCKWLMMNYNWSCF